MEGWPVHAPVALGEAEVSGKVVEGVPDQGRLVL